MASDCADLFAAPPTPLALNPGCSDAEIEQAEAQLGVRLPEPLASCLRASNGYTDLASRYPYGWNLTTIVTENLRAWSDRQAPLPSTLLAFGADGAGGWFCIPTDAPRGIYHWNWIDAAAEKIADDLPTFWRSWLDGTLKV